MFLDRLSTPGSIEGWLSICAVSRPCCCPEPDPTTTTSTGRFPVPCSGSARLLVTPPPQPDRLIDGYLSALDDAARAGPICVGGVSIGAAVAAAWALAHPDRTVAVLAALPAWTGAPGISARRSRGPAFGVPAASRRSGGDDHPDAGIQPALAGRGTDPVVAGSVAAVARRDGGSGGLRRAQLRRADPAGRATGRSRRGR